jgi:uncharacterized protein (TIGR03435 family)
MPSSVVRLVMTAVAALCALPASAQTAAPSAGFEVAVIRLNKTCESGTGGSGVSPGRVGLTCVPLRTLIRAAYSAFEGSNLASRLIEVVGGPDWLDSDRYDLAAKAEGGVPASETLGPMLRTLLEERCKLKVHKEPRDTAVYTLAVAKDGPKLQAAKEGDCAPIDLNNIRLIPKPGEPGPKYCGTGDAKFSQGKYVADWYAISMPEIAGRMLPGYVDRPVVDKTGLTGRYDIHLEFAREIRGPVRLNGVLVPEGTITLPDSSGPNIFAAVQSQLGLKLTPEKSPVDILVVDHVEKPADND